MDKFKYILCLLAVALFTSAAIAQEAPKEPKKNSESLEDILKKQSEESLEEIRTRAANQRLLTELEEVAEELEASDAYKEDKVEKAVAELLDGKDKKLSQVSNIKKICDAFAIVDDNFAALYKQLKEAKTQKQLATLSVKIKAQLKSLEDVQEQTYANCVYYWLYSQCLDNYLKDSKADVYKTAIPWKCMEAYRDILFDLRAKISFASVSALRCAEILEKMNRMFYALEMYTFVLKNYSLTMPSDKVKLAQARYDQLAAIYKNPLGALSEMASGVEDRFNKNKVDKATEEDANDIVLLLEDLIKTTEEKQKAKSKRKKQENKNQKQQDSKKDGQKSGSKSGGKQQGSSKGQSKGGKTPSKATNPATKPYLPSGAFKNPGELKSQDDGTSGGAWAKLPPNKREAAKKDIRKRGSKYRDQARDFSRRLSGSNE